MPTISNLIQHKYEIIATKNANNSIKAFSQKENESQNVLTLSIKILSTKSCSHTTAKLTFNTFYH